MKRASLAAFAATLVIGSASVSAADEATISEQRLLGSATEEADHLALLTFTREHVARVVVADGLSDSLARDGVPAATAIEALKALATAIDSGEIATGDTFEMRYSETYTSQGVRIGVGRVLWLELGSAAKGRIALHRFRTRDKTEHLFLVNGQKAAPPALRFPLETIAVSSAYGPRIDPFGAGTAAGATGGPANPGLSKVGAAMTAGTMLPPGLPGSSSGGTTVLRGDTISATPGYAGLPMAPARPRFVRALTMHAGVDFVAPYGTPVFAAADGVVLSAARDGGYGNAIRIEHTGAVATLYGHLKGFAGGIVPGASVSRGELIGFVGSTGRSTGPHLHFELQVNGKPVNPIGNAEFKAATLRGPDLDRFQKQVARSLAERHREAMASELQ